MERTKIVYIEYNIRTDLPVKAVREIVKRHTHNIEDSLATSAEEPPRILENSKGVTVIFGPFKDYDTYAVPLDFEKITQTLDKIVEDIEKEVRRLEALNSDLHLLQSKQEESSKSQNALAACGIEVIS
ncbi:MAG: hypothetical protein ACXQT3_03845 [Methermicoccaceae archaeon]